MAKKPDISVEVLERHDPTEGITDGDPAYDFMLDPETVPSDAHFVWVRQSADPKLDDVAEYKGRRYRPVTSSDGVKLSCGLEFADGEIIHQRDHILMARDLEFHNKRTAAEQKANRDLRAKMLNPRQLTSTHYIGGPQNGPAPMRTR